MKKKANADLREYSETKNVPQWKIAKGFQVADTTLCKWMREEFSEEMKAKYRKIVDSITDMEGETWQNGGAKNVFKSNDQ